MYGSEAWCLKASEMGNLQRTERSAVRAKCGVQLKDRKSSKDLMLNETIDRWTTFPLIRERDTNVLNLVVSQTNEGGQSHLHFVAALSGPQNRIAT